MGLSGLHTNWLHGSYTNDRDYEIKKLENAKLFLYSTNLNAHPDTKAKGTSVAIGYGYDLKMNISTLRSDLASYVTASSDLNKVYNIVYDYYYNGNPKHLTLNLLVTEINKYLDLGTEASASALLAYTVNKKESKLDARLGYQMPQSRERAVLMSMVYNGGSGKNLIGDNLKAAIINDNRAEAWFEIRYNSNGGSSESPGLANRRYNESYLFGLYDAGSPLTTEEAKEVMSMYTWGKVAITSYEMIYSPSAGEFDFGNIAENIKPAKDYLIANFSMGNTINGEVYVGGGLASYAYVEKNRIVDDLIGTDQNDLIFGEKGDDRITGNKGDDILMGGEGNDTYIINTGDGTDRIEDKGNNKVIMNGKLIGDFIKKPDGTFITGL